MDNNIIELKKQLTEFLKNNGSEHFSKLISDSIDESTNRRESISYYHKAISEKIKAFGELNLLNR